MSFGLDSTKQINIITSYKLLEFLGDIGGFLEALEIICMFIGSYFSSRFFKANFIEKYFKRKVQLKKADNSNSKSSGFKKIKLSMAHILFEPVIAQFISWFCWCKSCKVFQIR